MAEKTNVLSARVSQGTRDQLEELKKESGKNSDLYQLFMAEALTD
ncbi:MAG: hypothetical protein WBV93_00415 [Anaerobacillus sp.]